MYNKTTKMLFVCYTKSLPCITNGFRLISMKSATQFNVRLPERLKESLEQAAEYKKEKPSVFVREAIKERVEKVREEFRRASVA